MRQSACLVINPITADTFAALFNCMPVDRASDSMMTQPKAIDFSWLGPEALLPFCLVHWGLTDDILLLHISRVLFGSPGISNCHVTCCIC